MNKVGPKWKIPFWKKSNSFLPSLASHACQPVDDDNLAPAAKLAWKLTNSSKFYYIELDWKSWRLNYFLILNLSQRTVLAGADNIGCREQKFIISCQARPGPELWWRLSRPPSTWSRWSRSLQLKIVNQRGLKLSKERSVCGAEVL